MSLDLNDKKAVLIEAKNDLCKGKEAHWKKLPLTGAGNTGSQNVVTGFISNTGMKASRTYPCHAPIRQFVNAAALWSAFGYRCDKETAERYLRWVCYTSPWSMTGIIPDEPFDYLFNQGFIFQDLDKTPANLLHNFLIATRMAAEWPDFIKDWVKLVDAGIDESYAFFMLTMFYPVTNGYPVQESWGSADTVTWTGLDKYDWPLDVFRASNSYVQNFLSGKTEGLDKKMFYPSCNTAPVNTLWGKLTPGQGEYISRLKKDYVKLFTESRSSSQFGSHILITATKKDVMTLLREEEARFNLKQRKAA